MSGGKVKDQAHVGSIEANVVIEMRMADPMSPEVLDANSDDVLNAVEKRAADVALGPAIALNIPNCAIRLRFDVTGKTLAQIYKKISKVMAAIEDHSDLAFASTVSSVEPHVEDVDSPTGEFAVRC